MPDVKALGSAIHYQESGNGTPFVFLHGNPGSSQLWSKVLPRVGPGRLLAPDLIGMGRSGKHAVPRSAKTPPGTRTGEPRMSPRERLGRRTRAERLERPAHAHHDRE
jgi:pimeloyl-ACP methyl ester carboxylesterase